jgi:hypothetical protein
MPEPRGDVLEFVDGSALHGNLGHAWTSTHGLTWVNPEARIPSTSVRPTWISSVSPTPSREPQRRRAISGSATGTTCMVPSPRWMTSGWVSAPGSAARWSSRARRCARSRSCPPITPSCMKGLTTRAAGWWSTIRPKVGPFMTALSSAPGQGTLGRDLNLTNSATVEFDLAWSGVFIARSRHLLRRDGPPGVNGGSCVVDLTPGKSIFARPRTWEFSSMQSARRCPRAGRKAGCTWPSSATSGGHVFPSSSIIFWPRSGRIATFRAAARAVLFKQQQCILQRDPQVEPSQRSANGRAAASRKPLLPPPTPTPFISSITTGRPGKSRSIQDGKPRLALGSTVLDIPLERVTQIEFAAAKRPPAEPSGPWQVRAHFPGGGSLSFQLEKWDDKMVSGQSAILAPWPSKPAPSANWSSTSTAQEDGVAADHKEFEELDE